MIVKEPETLNVEELETLITSLLGGMQPRASDHELITRLLRNLRH